MMVGVLLAGGASTRMGSAKALKKTTGESFLVAGVRRLWAACDTVVVVLGANASRIRSAAEAEFETLVSSGELMRQMQVARAHGADSLELHFVVNAAWKRGMLSSARAGLDAALELAPEGVLLLPVDHPAVLPPTVASLAEVLREAIGAFAPAAPARRAAKGAKAAKPAKAAKASKAAQDGFAYAVVPRYQRRRGHPIALSPALARAVAADREADDLSDAVRRHARLVGYLDVPDPGVVRNRNRPRD